MNGRSAADRARHGDLDAFEELMHARIDSIFRLSYAIVGDEADARDATQETFIAAWRRIRELRDTDRFDAWLQRIAVNSARMTLRARGRRRVREIPSGDVSALATAAERVAPAVRADADLLGAALDVLSIDQRTILVLHHLEGHAVAELAEILAVPVGTVKSRLHTARRALQDALAAEGHVA
ncbi:MAG: RNA polymerase sigma factor [Chloroflexota bacterium]